MQLSAEQAFRLPLSNPKSEQIDVTQTSVEIEVPKEHPKDYFDEYSENQVLKAELAKKKQTFENNFFNKVVLRCARLENHNVNLELKLQHQKESFLNNRSFNNQNALENPDFFKINEWQAKLDAKDVSIANLRKHIESIKGNNVVDNDVQLKNRKVIAPGMFKLDLEPLAPKEVLVYVTATCPNLSKPSEKFVAVTPLNKNKKVRMKSSTSASRSQHSGNTKNNRISQTTISNMKNNVEYHSRSCMFDANHDLCLLEFVNDVNVRYKSKSANSSKRKKTWKPTGKVFTNIGYRWKPTRWTFTIAVNTYPLTRITSIKVEPLMETTSKSVTTPNPEIKIYRRKTKVAKSIDLRSEPSHLGSRPSNISEPNKHWGSTVSNSPSSSLVNFRLSKLFSGIWTLDAPSI
ncbi:hypothetical protein Tco_0865815 [Tanacetum coccineum]